MNLSWQKINFGCSYYEIWEVYIFCFRTGLHQRVGAIYTTKHQTPWCGLVSWATGSAKLVKLNTENVHSRSNLNFWLPRVDRIMPWWRHRPGMSAVCLQACETRKNDQNGPKLQIIRSPRGQNRHKKCVCSAGALKIGCSPLDSLLMLCGLTCWWFPRPYKALHGLETWFVLPEAPPAKCPSP